jgi:hypothetical protein
MKRTRRAMKNGVRVWPTIMLIIGAVGVVMGVVFIYQGVTKSNLLKEAMRVEKITLDFIPGVPKGEIIDTAKKAMLAGDTIREHRRQIAPTYEALLGGKKFNPANPKDLIYAQALNMENYLYLAVVGFGLTDVATASGVFMIIMGIAIGGTGITLYKVRR